MKNRIYSISALINLFFFIISIQLFFSCASFIFFVPDEEESVIIIGRAPQQSLDPQSIRVLVWNVYKEKRDFLPNFMILKKNSDLILLQEAVKHSEAGFSLINTQYEWIYAKSFYYSKQERSTGLLTGSRAVAKAGFLLRTKTTEPISQTPKNTLFNYYSLERYAFELLVVNVHKINFVGFSKFEHEIDQIMDVIGAHQGPVLLAGDFNTWNKRRYMHLDAVTAGLGLNKVNFEPDYRKTMFGYHLDYIFVRGLDVQKAATFDTRKASDHNPMVVDFSLPGY